MYKFSHLIILFSITFAVMFMGPAFLGGQFAPFPLMKWGVVFDLFTPIILLPLYWLLFEDSSKQIMTVFGSS